LENPLKVVFYILLLSIIGFVLGITSDFIVYDLTHGRVFSWLYTATFTIAFGIIGIVSLTLSKVKSIKFLTMAKIMKEKGSCANWLT
jgi:hypothetical protein